MNADCTDMRAADVCCASCGIAEIDGVKLKQCPHCDRARYCSDECQKDHREIHQTICEERAAELHDEILFRQPEGSFRGDCPICFLPMPLLDSKKSILQPCCGKVICKGCDYANCIREMEQKVKPRCPFCRKPIISTDEEKEKSLTKRAAANDPVALLEMGWMRHEDGDYDKAFEYWERAAELGDAGAHCILSTMYRTGHRVEKDEGKEVYHLEEAAIAGHPSARYNLGMYEGREERYDRAVKHWIISANLGHDDSLQALKHCYKEGHVSKDDFAAALRAHQAAVDETKSPQREMADTWHKVFRMV